VAFEFQTDEQRAAALRSSLRGAAFDCIKSIYSHQPNTYEQQWDKLERRYSDVSSCMQNVYKKLSRSKPVLIEDHKALVHNVLDKSTAVKIEESDQVSHGALKLQVQDKMNAHENLDVSQEILPEHYLQSCSRSEPRDSSKVSQSVSGTSSSQPSGSQLGLSQVKQEKGEAYAEHPITLLLQTPNISADDNDLQSDDNNQLVIPTTIEIDKSSKSLNYEENTGQAITYFWKCKSFPKKPEVKLKEVTPQDPHQQIVFTSPVFYKSQASTARHFHKAKIENTQTATKGDKNEWWWIKGNSNVSDWVSKTKSSEKIGPVAEVPSSLKSVKRTEIQHFFRNFSKASATQDLSR